jgi:hypothetical protein
MLFLYIFIHFLVVTSFLSIFLQAASHSSVLVSGVLGCLLSPLAVFQQRKVTQIKAFEQTNALIEKEIVQLELVNQTLQQSVQQLQESVLE